MTGGAQAERACAALAWSAETAGQSLYLLTGMLTRLAGTVETGRDVDDEHQADAQVSGAR